VITLVVRAESATALVNDELQALPFNDVDQTRIPCCVTMAEGVPEYVQLTVADTPSVQAEVPVICAEKACPNPGVARIIRPASAAPIPTALCVLISNMCEIVLDRVKRTNRRKTFIDAGDNRPGCGRSRRIHNPGVGLLLYFFRLRGEI
jgi:hypothetical protein